MVFLSSFQYYAFVVKHNSTKHNVNFFLGSGLSLMISAHIKRQIIAQYLDFKFFHSQPEWDVANMGNMLHMVKRTYLVKVVN